MKLVEHINFIVDFTTKLEEQYFGKKSAGQLFEEDSFFLIFNIRINRILRPLSILLQNDSKQIAEFSSFILLRPLLQDSLYILYLLHQLEQVENKKDRLLNLSKVALSDGIDRHKGFIDRLKQVGKIDSKQHLEMYEQIVALNAELIDSEKTIYPGKIIFYQFRVNGKEKLNATDLFDLLKGTKKKDTACKLYELYYDYSKYDHYTIDSFKLSKHFNNKDKEHSVSKSVYLIIDQFTNYFQILDWYNNDEINLNALFSEYKNWLNDNFK